MSVNYENRLGAEKGRKKITLFTGEDILSYGSVIVKNFLKELLLLFRIFTASAELFRVFLADGTHTMKWVIKNGEIQLEKPCLLGLACGGNWSLGRSFDQERNRNIPNFCGPTAIVSTFLVVSCGMGVSLCAYGYQCILGQPDNYLARA